ncbi:NEDD8 ultimate buster 1-like isoform X2 [Spodoptera litura]|uniref:NEDD8 ultimate buster 1-like isoform X2 n=1 Tax=Spodoptera litura TaxID=69820 RepID=A0A9J7IQ60_SPOLT|nr:NEDD8 ultimate buster 1-like isoform X2 [Spodoptera litura]
MDNNLQHEDLLIKLRAKLNQEKVKLWEPPFIAQDNEITQDFKNIAEKYAKDLSLETEVVQQALRELQLHSLERSKDNEEFKETGFATFRVKATIPGEKPKMMKLQKKLDGLGSELIAAIAAEIGVTENRVKLIYNGKVIKPTPSMEQQGLKNGATLMALVMAETPEEVKKEENMYMEMKTVRDDATLLSEYVDELADDEEYIKLEDQSGATVELPPAERRALVVGLALHERGRTAARHHDYSLALVLFLEADRQLSECRSSILQSVDNWAVLQLDVAWSYLCLRSLPQAADAAQRLARAEAAFRDSYGEDHARLIALKGSAANERVLLMRMYLLQGIVCYHQNKRAEARALLAKAETELNALRVDEDAVLTLMELGWSRAAARTGLRAAAGHVDTAHHYLADRRAQRDRAREAHRNDRQRRLLGVCEDGSQINLQLVEALVGMGYPRSVAVCALRNSNNHVAEAVRLIQEQPELLVDSDRSSDDASTISSDDSNIVPDNKLVAELEAMGYEAEQARAALRLARNHISGAVDALVAGGGLVLHKGDPEDPSTSSGVVSKKKKAKKAHKKDKRRKERDQALRRLTASIKTEEDDYLDTSLTEEEEFLAQYKSLL